MQMAIYQQSLQLLNGLANCISLMQYIYTVFILFNHFAYATQMSLNIVHALEDLLFISVHLHTPFSPYPPGRGMYTISHAWDGRKPNINKQDLQIVSIHNTKSPRYVHGLHERLAQMKPA